MPSISFSDMEALPDPLIDEIARAVLIILNSQTAAQEAKQAIEREMSLNRWRKADLLDALRYAISKGWLSEENGNIKITEKWRENT